MEEAVREHQNILVRAGKVRCGSGVWEGWRRGECGGHCGGKYMGRGRGNKGILNPGRYLEGRR